MLLAKDIMTREVISIHHSASIKELSKLLSEQGITGVPVTDEHNRLVGMISMRDVIREQVLHMGENFENQDIYELFSSVMHMEERPSAPAPQMWVADVMTQALHTAAEDTPARDICKLMFDHNIHRVPVLRDGKVVGVVTAMDIVRTVADGMSF